jgi:hypothetical protein
VCNDRMLENRDLHVVLSLVLLAITSTVNRTAARAVISTCGVCYLLLLLVISVEGDWTGVSALLRGGM